MLPLPSVARRPLPVFFRLALGVLVLGLALPAASQAAWPTAVERGPVTDALSADDFKRAPAVKAQAADPAGDTFGEPDFDFTSLEARLVDGVVSIGLRFDEDVVAPGQDGGLTGFVDLDIDRDGSTGAIGWVDTVRGEAGLPGASGLGIEAYVDLFTYSEADGAVDLVDDVTQDLIARVPASFSGDAFDIAIDSDLLGGTEGVDLAATVGDVQGPSDLAPNQGSVSAVAGTTVVLQGGRFLVEVAWETSKGELGLAEEVVAANDSAVLSFFGSENWEILAKVLDGCPVNDHWWVFFSGSTDVGFELVVFDTLTGATKIYTNPLGQPANAVNDTVAFPCP